MVDYLHRMRIIHQNETAGILPCVATVGFFDGVHIGHRFLIEELKTIAKEQNLKSTVITFATHPRKILKSDFQPELLTTPNEKLIQLESTGIDACVVLEFTPDMAQLSAYEFLKTILSEQYQVRTLLVGHDHRFGHNRAEGFPEYQKYGKELGIEVIQAKRYTIANDEHISSSTVRQALQTGDIEHANRLLSYEYSFSGKVIKGFMVGRGIGFPTANLLPEDTDKLVPANGVYAVRVKRGEKYYKGMMNIGNRPTLDNGKNISLEVHIIDFNEDIYDETLGINFIRKIRDEKKFNGLDELVKQLQKDKQFVIELNYDTKNE